MIDFLRKINNNHIRILENMIESNGLTSKTQDIMVTLNWYFNVAFLSGNKLIESKRKDKTGCKIWTVTDFGKRFIEIIKECEEVWVNRYL